MIHRHSYSRQLSYQSKPSRFLLQITLLLTLLAGSLFSQKQYHRFIRKEFGVETLRSANGHGLQLSPFFGLTENAHHWMLQALVDPAHGELRGGRAYYSFNLSGYRHAYNANNNSPCAPEPLQLNWFCYFQCLHRALLSPAVLRHEAMIQHDRNPEWNSLRYSTAEGGAGAEIRVNFNYGFCWRTNIAVALYENFHYVPGMDHEQRRVCVSTSTALSWVFL